MSRFLFILLITAWAGSAHAVIHFVPDDFLNLQEALDESNQSDTIVCRDGTYYGPFFIWARNVTIASEFILDQNSGHILNCIIRPPRGDREHRCFFTEPADSTHTSLRMIGMTLTFGFAISEMENRGGGIYIQNRTANIEDCIFKSCRANYGGAIYASGSILNLTRCSFIDNDSRNWGRMMQLSSCNTILYSCDLGPNGSFFLHNPGGGAPEINMSGGEIELFGTRIHDIGRVGGYHEVLGHYQGSAPRSIRTLGCTIEQNLLSNYYNPGSPSANEFVLDSCVIRNNQIAFGFFPGGVTSAMHSAVITRNWFESNTQYPGTGGPGLISVYQGPNGTVIEENYFVQNFGYQAGCLSIGRVNNPLIGRVQRNFFVENGSGAYPFEIGRAIVLDRVGEGVLEYNSFHRHPGAAVFTMDWFSPTSYALHNFWGDSTGPYEATRNPGGLGDTTNAATIYDEWLLSEDEIPDTSLFPPPNAADDRRWTVPSTWFISSVYPNPFNSEFRIELDGMTGADFEVRLFDLLGREVALLYSGRTLRGTLSFQAPSDLATGVYFLHAKDHLYGETKKVLYLK